MVIQLSSLKSNQVADLAVQNGPYFHFLAFPPLNLPPLNFLLPLNFLPPLNFAALEFLTAFELLAVVIVVVA